jgi:hypothetical protein
MSQKKTNRLMGGLERIGSGALFALRVIRDAFRAPFELPYMLEELADQGWRSHGYRKYSPFRFSSKSVRSLQLF